MCLLYHMLTLTIEPSSPHIYIYRVRKLMAFLVVLISLEIRLGTCLPSICLLATHLVHSVIQMVCVCVHALHSSAFSLNNNTFFRIYFRFLFWHLFFFLFSKHMYTFVVCFHFVSTSCIFFWISVQ